MRLLTEVEAFLAETGMTESTFGRRFYNNSHFVELLRQGRSCREDVADRVRSQMDAYLRRPVDSRGRRPRPPAAVNSRSQARTAVHTPERSK